MTQNTDTEAPIGAQLDAVVGSESRQGHGDGIHVLVRILGHNAETFSVSPHSTLLHVMAEAVRLAGLSLLPPKQPTFDRLHVLDGEHVGAVIDNVEQTIAHYVGHANTKPSFAVELMRTFRVNTRWDVAPREELSPKEILALPRIHLSHNDFTLYLPGSNDPLPLDSPVRVERGAEFEAQRDGKYGGDCENVS